MTQQEISSILNQYDLNELECDGSTRVIHTILSEYKIQHFCYVGTARYNNQEVYPHFWIKCGSLIIDYKIKMWLGNIYGVLEGVFEEPTSMVVYEGDITNIPVLEKPIFNMLINNQNYENT